MGRVTKDNVEEVMTYQVPDVAQIEAFEHIKYASIILIKTIINNAPDCADRTTAIRKVREVRMDANSAIAFKGKI